MPELIGQYDIAGEEQAMKKRDHAQRTFARRIEFLVNHVVRIWKEFAASQTEHQIAAWRLLVYRRHKQAEKLVNQKEGTN
jgi:hypothetical protein